MKIALVNMPFAALTSPSLALTQLQSIIREELATEATADIHYLNLDFGVFLGAPLYQDIAFVAQHLYTGVGDWLFRHLAFPELPDNATQYYRRFYPSPDGPTTRFREVLEAHRAKLGDCLDRAIESHRLIDCDVVGLTSIFAQSVACFALARRLKAMRPSIVTVMGGANCEGAMGRAIAANVSSIDFVCSGSGSRSFPELIRRLGGMSPSGGSSIPGIYPCRGSATAMQLMATPTEELGMEKPIDDPIDLDYEPFLDALERAFPRREVQPLLLFETSRGCWWGQKSHCTFCGLNGSTMGFRSMKPDRALAQFRALFRYFPRCTELSCVDNILPKHYVADVLPYVEPPTGVRIYYEIKADLSEAELRVLSAAGVRRVQPGVESLATSTLKLMRKGSSAFTNLRLLLSCRICEIEPSWNLLMGFPVEEANVFEKYVRDIPLLTHLMPPSGAFPIRFDRFSPYFDRAPEYHLDLRPLAMYDYVYSFDKDVIRDLAYYFEDKHVDADYKVAMLEMLRPVQDAVVQWYHRHLGLDGGAPAELFIVPNSEGRGICDTRSGVSKQYVLSAQGAKLLAYLNRPTSLQGDATAREYTADGVPLAELRDLGLIFEEEGRAMSIVNTTVPPRVAASLRHVISYDQTTSPVAATV